ncbi:MAG: hypothetical protein HKP54_03980, partial [Boseongicola sp.]|nr:hypothetical protein [Boseongicola sp.]
RETIINELREDGFQEIRISRTLLGRTRFVATNETMRREIVVNPTSGVVLRDYIRFLRDRDDDDNGGFGQGSPHSGNDEDEDEDHDDDHDDDEDQDDDSEEDDDDGDEDEEDDD